MTWLGWVAVGVPALALAIVGATGLVRLAAGGHAWVAPSLLVAALLLAVLAVVTPGRGQSA